MHGESTSSQITEDDLNRASEAIQWLLPHIPAAAYACDAQSCVRAFNDAAVRLWGRNPEGTESIRQLFAGFKFGSVDGESVAFDDSPLAVAHRSDDALGRAELLIESPSGSCTPFAVRTHPWLNGAARPLGATWILERIAGPDAPIAAERFPKSIVASSDDAIVSKDVEGLIQSWNAGAERLFGYSADEAIGRPITIIIPPDLEGEEGSIFERLRSGERISHYETWRIDKEGRRKPISLSVSPIKDAAGGIIGAATVARDISAQRAAAENALLYQELREADRRKDEFLAVLAHELRNPLAPLRNALEIMRLSKGGGSTLDGLRAIMETQVQHLVRLVDDLLDVSRITRGKIELRKEDVSLTTVIETAVETSRPHIDAAGHKLELELPEQPIRLQADPVRIAQVISNLLNNASKFTPRPGHIRLSAQLEANETVIRVEDNGQGISHETLPRIFGMFSQVENVRAQSQGGLGLGLAVSKGLVELHGGTIQASSDGPGCGACFTIRLPTDSRWNAVREEGEPTVTRRPLPRRRVVVVDDTRVAAYTLGRLLETLNQEVFVAYDARSALDLVRSRRPHVVISDISMPDMDGYELANRIRGSGELHGIRLVALTGYGQDADRRRTRAAGFDSHLVKPVSIAALHELLSTLPALSEPARH